MVVLSYHKVEAEQQLQGHDRSNKACIARQRRSRLSETELHLNNYDYRAKPGPGLRRTAVATAAERLPVCA